MGSEVNVSIQGLVALCVTMKSFRNAAAEMVRAQDELKEDHLTHIECRSTSKNQ
jgi:hypothetical protein